ncbi:hypothetical protein C7Y72_08815 [Paraconexibacter algicola]|uniref:Uncharacterized protein n=1 Tax=Paraconexibacter algicola TaxID=2133960 RepID=A0A2T4UKM2_9ACTN|nr:hypothetical protein C7Y72_08815 [Paraconexibacter algicola]
MAAIPVRVKAPVVPRRYWTAMDCTASSAEPSMSRALKLTVTSLRPVASTRATMPGASAVPEPASAIVGLAIANSVTPPVEKVFGAVWLALTSRTVESAVAVRGSTPVAVTTSSPRKPWIAGTPLQLSSTVMRPALDQSWLSGPDASEWAVVSATAVAGSAARQQRTAGTSDLGITGGDASRGSPAPRYRTVTGW